MLNQMGRDVLAQKCHLVDATVNPPDAHTVRYASEFEIVMGSSDQFTDSDL